MTLTEEQRALYRAVADGKRVEVRGRYGEWVEWDPAVHVHIGSPGVEFRIAPDTITITIPRPKNFWLPVGVDRTAMIAYETDADAQAFIDAVRGAG